MIRIGYVGVNTLLPSASKTFRIRNYTEENMLQVAGDNLVALEQILKWNLEHEITLFRITSHLIPYGSSPINSGSWKNVFKPDFNRIGNFIKNHNMRVSMHPGQYSVLNTPNENFFRNAANDLEYHNTILDLMELDSSHKIILHGGGGYGDRKHSINMIKTRFSSLSEGMKSRICLENDDRIFSAEEIYEISSELGIPAIFDILHHDSNLSFDGKSVNEIIRLYGETWKGIRQKIHYSNQDSKKRKGAHSESVDLELFGQFYEKIKELDLDIMLEVKDKQESLLKIRSIFPEVK